MAKIIFFNHYHRGDLLTHKEYVRQIKEELPEVEFGYMHFNHAKLTRDLDIPKVGEPTDLDPKVPYYQDGDVLYINTWIGSTWDIFCNYGGINMNSLWWQWERILPTINMAMGLQPEDHIKLRAEKESYLPTIDFTKFNVASIDEYLEQSKDKKKILICNGAPKSGQSFAYNMESFVHTVANKFPNIDFICTEKFPVTLSNIVFTDDIIKDSEIEEKRAPWEDRPINNCDVQEISYLSENCNAIVGKNSGPFVFCETKNNYMNPNQKFLSFNTSWGEAFHTGQKRPTETMSHDLQFNCEYNIVAVEGPYGGDLNKLTDDDRINIDIALKELTESL